MENIALHCYVSGRVQGVFYRQSTQDKANTLGVKGWVCNLPDGRVELIACGERTQVEVLRDWLREGPQGADVTDVAIEEIPWAEYPDFSVRFG